jgi:type IX secretion system PorP/SprF family membrane protein
MPTLRYLYRIVCLLLVGGAAHGQDLHFTQLYESPFLRNPSLAGIYSGQARVSAVFRNQWQSVTVPYQTSGAAIEYKLKGVCQEDAENINIGLQVMRDQAGDSKLTRTQIQAALSYRRQLNNGLFIAGGFLAGPVSSSFDPRGLKWDDQFSGGVFNPNQPTIQPILNAGRNYFDLSGGLSLNGGNQYASSQWYAGVALHHINQPSVGFGAANNVNTKLPMKWTFSGGFASVINDMDDRLIFHTDVIWQQPHREILLGAFFKKWLLNETGEADRGISLTMGGIYRWGDAFCPVVKLNVNQWSVGLSYDANISKLTAASQLRGGFEFTLLYRITGIASNCSRFGCVFD